MKPGIDKSSLSENEAFDRECANCMPRPWSIFRRRPWHACVLARQRTEGSAAGMPGAGGRQRVSAVLACHRRAFLPSSTPAPGHSHGHDNRQ